MQIHNLKRVTKNYKPVAVGRGGKRGKTSGRGTKGQNARSGRKKRPEMRDFIKRLPKLRGYSFKGYKEKAIPIQLKVIEAKYLAGETVSPTTLFSKGLIEMTAGKKPIVKILSDGEITKKVTIVDCKISAKAKEKVLKAGGSVASIKIIVPVKDVIVKSTKSVKK